MSLEFKISKELATLNATLIEWQRMYLVSGHILSNSAFMEEFSKMYTRLIDSFQLLIDSLEIWQVLQSEAQFTELFDQHQQDYQSRFLKLASQPRQIADATHEHYIQLSTMKEIRTGYPTLKRTFESLYEFIDKWVANDAWIVMRCDVIFKTTNRLLLDIKGIKKQSDEDAFLIYRSASNSFIPLLVALQDSVKRCQKDCLTGSEHCAQQALP